jgi:hypothetical protein
LFTAKATGGHRMEAYWSFYFELKAAISLMI